MFEMLEEALNTKKKEDEKPFKVNIKCKDFEKGSCTYKEKGVNLSIQLVAVTSTGRPASVSRSTALSCTTPRATRARPASRPDEQEHKQKHYEQNKEKAAGEI
jgi:hypothetical protein